MRSILSSVNSLALSGVEKPEVLRMSNGEDEAGDGDGAWRRRGSEAGTRNTGYGRAVWLTTPIHRKGAMR